MCWTVDAPNNVQDRNCIRHITLQRDPHNTLLKNNAFPHCAGEGQEAQDLKRRGSTSIQMEAATKEMTDLAEAQVQSIRKGPSHLPIKFMC